MRTVAVTIAILSLVSALPRRTRSTNLSRDGNGGPTENILTYGMGYHPHRYSPLNEINKQTIKRLVPVWPQPR